MDKRGDISFTLYAITKRREAIICQRYFKDRNDNYLNDSQTKTDAILNSIVAMITNQSDELPTWTPNGNNKKGDISLKLTIMFKDEVLGEQSVDISHLHNRIKYRVNIRPIIPQIVDWYRMEIFNIT